MLANFAGYAADNTGYDIHPEHWACLSDTASRAVLASLGPPDDLDGYGRHLPDELLVPRLPPPSPIPPMG